MSKVYFDTTIFCEAFEGTADQIALLAPLIDHIENHPLQVVTSELTLAELLGKEGDKGWAWQSRFYVDMLVHSGRIDLQPISRQILVETGDFRRRAGKLGRRVKLADAVHAVTAGLSGCLFVFTADKRFFVPAPLTTVLSEAIGVAKVKAAIDA